MSDRLGVLPRAIRAQVRRRRRRVGATAARGAGEREAEAADRRRLPAETPGSS
jgi:hypothetical protein